MSGTRVLYVSYDGMMEPLGQSQVLAYLRQLAKTNVIHLVSFEKPLDWRDVTRREAMRRTIREAGIRWHPLRYHKRPSALATAWDIARGTAVAIWLTWRHRLETVHARSYVASVIAVTLKRVTGVSYIFDMRGFWPEERVDGGLWPAGGRMYRVAKWFERRFLLSADYVVSLTRAGVKELKRLPYLQERMPPFKVIPTCTDLALFTPGPSPGRRSFVLGYVGSAGTWYLFDEAIASFRALLRLRPDARFLIVNRGEHAFIRQRLSVADIPQDQVELVSAAHEEVPRYMAEMTAGVFFIKPVFSKLASAPTKLGEFLGCGIPCLSNQGVGDMAEILESENVGIAVQDFSVASLDRALSQLVQLTQDPQTRGRCVRAARTHFSLEQGVAAYAAVYSSLSAATEDSGGR